MRECKHARIFENYFIKAIEHFFLVYIASSKHSEGWENSRKLCNSSRVCITVSNSPNRLRVEMRLYKHGKSALLLKFKKNNSLAFY